MQMRSHSGSSSPAESVDPSQGCLSYRLSQVSPHRAKPALPDEQKDLSNHIRE